MHGSITVIGAGAVGIASAIHLQQRGWQVTLVDRRPPASETSWGNAGVIAPGCPVPLNNPDLHRSLGSLLANDKAALRYSKAHVLRQLPWLLEFLRFSKTHAARRSTLALHALTAAAVDEHRAMMQRSGNGARFHENGWLKVFRSGGTARVTRELTSFNYKLLAELGVETRALDAHALRSLEPALSAVFGAGIHLVAGGFVDHPGLLMREHAARFVADGGEIRELDVSSIGREGDRLHYRTPDATVAVEHLLVAAGPWSADLLATAGYAVPLLFERGYHAHFGLAAGVALTHSVHDVDAGYTMSPMVGGLRVTTGVELAPRDASSNLAQIEQVTPRVAEAIAIDGRTDEEVWRGARPTLPDSRPAIGPLPGSGALWVNFGHQHIGFMTGPVCGKLVAQMLSGESPDVDMRPFEPARYVRPSRPKDGGWRGVRLGSLRQSR